MSKRHILPTAILTHRSFFFMSKVLFCKLSGQILDLFFSWEPPCCCWWTTKSGIRCYFRFPNFHDKSLNMRCYSFLIGWLRPLTTLFVTEFQSWLPLMNPFEWAQPSFRVKRSYLSHTCQSILFHPVCWEHGSRGPNPCSESLQSGGRFPCPKLPHDGGHTVTIGPGHGYHFLSPPWASELSSGFLSPLSSHASSTTTLMAKSGVWDSEKSSHPPDVTQSGSTRAWVWRTLELCFVLTLWRWKVWAVVGGRLLWNLWNHPPPHETPTSSYKHRCVPHTASQSSPEGPTVHRYEGAKHESWGPHSGDRGREADKQPPLWALFCQEADRLSKWHA